MAISLDTQSRTINETFDNKLIWAPINLKDGDIILDSGSGSGHWLLSLAKEVPPTITLLGIDIATHMFPSPPHPIPNLSFSPTSITSLPHTWSSTLSLINQRLLLCALQPSQWKLALSEMYRTLLPGGYIQLFEMSQHTVSPSQEILDHPAWKIRDKLCHDVRHLVMDITDHLQSWIEETGFINLTIHKRGYPLGSWAGDHGSRGLKCNMEFFEALKFPVMQAGGLGLVGSEEEYDEIMEDLRRRCEETPETYFEYFAFVAQKPVV